MIHDIILEEQPKDARCGSNIFKLPSVVLIEIVKRLELFFVYRVLPNLEFVTNSPRFFALFSIRIY
ncbi:hypothetical protein CUJ86_07855 [Methanofollis fontis]|uniref:Uncharacterized protein n=1 Tax=Methanofollis fontis TaxID=2052832 RepID=A0A483CM42_9EURY|nr:hypothetical protein CUJ86_07855 [Methanofollis fontis]